MALGSAQALHLSIARSLADIGGCPQDRKGVDALCRADQCLRTASLHVSHGLVCTRSRKVLLRIQARHQLLSLQVFQINYIATTSVSWQASCTFRSGMSCSFQLAVTWQVSCYSGRPNLSNAKKVLSACSPSPEPQSAFARQRPVAD